MSQRDSISKNTNIDILPQKLNKAQLTFISQKTPKHFIKQRPGPGGIILNYVEVGYIITILNQAFGYDWDFRITDQQVGKRQVWVRGELIVRVGERTIMKGQYGGSEIKLSKEGKPLSIADDLKAAASDCLKKCASMFGIAGDIYWKDLDNCTSEEIKKENKKIDKSLHYLR